MIGGKSEQVRGSKESLRIKYVKKNQRIHSFRHKLQTQPIQIDPKPLLKAQLQTLPLKCRTQQNSPRDQEINQQDTLFPSLPSTQTLLSQPRSRTNSQCKRIGLDNKKGFLKTTKLVDQLIKILKDEDQDEAPKSAKPARVFTQATEQFTEQREQKTTKKTKRPRIVSNHVTKLLFSQNTATRGIISEERSRKSARKQADFQEITFYGGLKFPVGLSKETTLEGKAQLDQLRLSKLHSKPK